MYKLLIAFLIVQFIPSSVKSGELDYSEAVAIAQEMNLPLITFVSQKSKPIPGCIVCSTIPVRGSAMRNGQIWVSWIKEGKHRGVPIPRNVEIKSAIRIILARNKIDIPKELGSLTEEEAKIACPE